MGTEERRVSGFDAMGAWPMAFPCAAQRHA